MASRSPEQRASHSQIEVVVHPGNEFLGSLEPESLQVLTYMKMMKEADSIATTADIWQSLKGSCPTLRHGSSATVTRAEEIITYLKEQGFDLDEKLKEEQRNEIVAYNALLSDRLLPAILYSRWLDGQNYVDVTRKMYGEHLHFPFSLFYLSWRHRSVQHLVMRGTSPECTLEQRGRELLSKAEECLSLLSARLGDTNDYFFGSSPSSLDALMFGYLEVILQSPLSSNNSLYSKLHSSINLTEFCKRIRANHFPEKKTMSKVRATPPLPRLPTTIWKDPTVWVSVGVAAVVLGVQGVRVGLFHRIGRWIMSKSHSFRWNSSSISDSDE